MLCPNCDKEITELHLIEKREYTFRGNKVKITDRFCRCPECKEEWSEDKFDFAEEVFDAWIRQHLCLNLSFLKKE